MLGIVYRLCYDVHMESMKCRKDAGGGREDVEKRGERERIVRGW